MNLEIQVGGKLHSDGSFDIHGVDYLQDGKFVKRYIFPEDFRPVSLADSRDKSPFNEDGGVLFFGVQASKGVVNLALRMLAAREALNLAHVKAGQIPMSPERRITYRPDLTTGQ